MISIVIPMYNAAETILQTLESLEDSMIPHEIIIVDDGSTDESYQLCTEYARHNEHIILIRQENKGVSGARNRGIRQAKGKYIWFIDADDWAMPGALEAIHQMIHKAQSGCCPDIILSNMYVTGSDKIPADKYVYLFNKSVLYDSNKDGIFQYLYQIINIGFVVWRHIFNTQFIKSNDIWFDESLVMFEDMDWMLRALIKAKTFDGCDSIIYRHRFDNSNSLTRNKRTYRLFCNFVQTCIKWFDYFQSHEYCNCDRKAILNQISDSYKCAFTFATALDKKEKQEALSLYMSRFDIVRYHCFNDFDRLLLIK